MRVYEVIALLGVASCPSSNATDGGAAPNVSMATVKLVTSTPGTGAVTPPKRDPTVCRVITATGGIRKDTRSGEQADAGVVAAGDVSGDTFFLLPGGSRLAIKNGNTTRETIFEGPGDVRVCVGGEEEMRMTSGVFTSVAGAGESPGAEVWIVTPQGVVRYGSGARVRILGSTGHADIQLSDGGAFAYAIDGLTSSRDAGAPPHAGSDGWFPVTIGTTLGLASKKAPSQIIGDCEQAAKDAHDLAVRIGAHDASLALGDAAPRHVVLRQKAHAICAVAELVAERSLDIVERERLLPRARAGSAKWRDSSTQ